MGNCGKYMKSAKPEMSGYVGPVNSWKSLGVAIVRQAIIDWRVASLRLTKPSTASIEMSELKRSAEHFLSSPLCEFYSGLDGKTIMRKLKEGLI